MGQAALVCCNDADSTVVLEALEALEAADVDAGDKVRQERSYGQLPTLLKAAKDGIDEVASWKGSPKAQAEDSDGDDVSDEGLFCARHYTHAEKSIIREEQFRWAARWSEVDRQRRAADFAALLEQTRYEMTAPLIESDLFPANRYGNNAELPAFDPGRHVPILGLVNPCSGAQAGRDILSIANKSPYYQERFFNIGHVVKDQRRGGLLDVFRIELCKARDEARTMGTRARIISGGGDGTASFALFVVFAALRADESRAEEGLADTGNGFIWTDEEFAEGFPALAQMPLGSANDFGHTLGWGQKYPGDLGAGCGERPRALRALQEWIEAVLEPAAHIANFDIFGIMPLDGKDTCDFKVCELTGKRGVNPKVRVDGTQHLLMKEATIPVPLFCCLYFSAGFAAYVTARFQLNRRCKPFRNKLEYVRQAMGIVTERVPPQLSVGLDDVEISCGRSHYFPPRADEGNTGRKYVEVGFLNINRTMSMVNGADRAPICGRVCSTREPAKFNDGKIDMYRMKFASPIKNPSLILQTDKAEGGMTLTYKGGQGKGVFFQWDGEARFAFSPGGEPFNIHVRKILNVPVVLGPEYDPRVAGDPDNGQQSHFAFAGQTPAQREAVRRRIAQNVSGKLNAELNATLSEIKAAGLRGEAK